MRTPVAPEHNLAQELLRDAQPGAGFGVGECRHDAVSSLGIATCMKTTGREPLGRFAGVVTRSRYGSASCCRASRRPASSVGRGTEACRRRTPPAATPVARSHDGRPTPRAACCSALRRNARTSLPPPPPPASPRSRASSCAGPSRATASLDPSRPLGPRRARSGRADGDGTSSSRSFRRPASPPRSRSEALRCGASRAGARGAGERGRGAPADRGETCNRSFHAKISLQRIICIASPGLHSSGKPKTRPRRPRCEPHPTVRGWPRFDRGGTQ